MLNQSDFIYDNPREDLYLIEADIAHSLGEFYLKWKERLKGHPNSLGVRKELPKYSLEGAFNQLANYIDFELKKRKELDEE